MRMKKGSKQKKPAHKRIEKVFSAMLCILSALGLAKDIALNQNEHFLFPPAADQNPKEYAQAMHRLRNQSSQSFLSRRPDFQPAVASFTAYMVMLFDTEIYDLNRHPCKLNRFSIKSGRRLGNFNTSKSAWPMES